MLYRQIIKEAWQFTQSNKRLMKWYAFVPSLISSIVGIIYISYQYLAFKNSALFSSEGHSFLTKLIKDIALFIKLHPGLSRPLIITAVIVIIIYLLLPTFSQGAIVQITARKRNGQDVKLIDGVTYGLKCYLPLLEYHLILKGFSLTSILTEMAFVSRNLGTEALKFLLPIFGFITIIGLFIGLIFTYGQNFIIIDNEGVFASMKKSALLVLHHWQQTFLILILFMLISLRVILNILLILVIPFLLILAFGFFASLALAKTGIIIAIVIALGAMYVSGYLGGTLSVFSNAVWTFTFLELTKKDLPTARAEGDGTEIG